MHEVLEFAANHGYTIRNLELDGKIHRLDRSGKKSAWYVGWTANRMKGDGQIVTAVFGDWKTGETFEYKTNGATKLTRAESKIMKEWVAEAAQQAEAERKSLEADAIKRARELWESGSRTSTSSEYLEKKKLTKLYGARSQMEDRGRTLYIAMRGIDSDAVVGLQRINEDGTKRFVTGQRISNNFAVIGQLDDTTETVLVCEGWATGATLHEATSQTVVCAMAASNIKRVVAQLSKRWPGLSITVCGDNDEAGRKAAESVGVRTVYPDCAGDFNDLYCERGIEAVQKIISKVDVQEDDHGFVPLGVGLCSGYYFYKRATRTVIEMRGFSDTDFLRLQPSHIWDARFPGAKGGFNKREATDYLIALSDRAGIYDTRNQRGTGCWRDRGQLIYNTGRRLLDNYGADVRGIKSRFVYTASSQQTRNEPSPVLGDAEASYLVDACEIFRWRDPTMGKMLAGWLALSRVAACLPKRYHAWISGPSDTGKTDVMERLVRFAIGEDAHVYFKGSTTEAGLRQTIASTALPVVFDEFESDGVGSIERVASILELLRMAYDSGTIIKGSSGGQPQAFAASFPAIVSSIRVALDNDADRSRFLLLELQPLLPDQAARSEHYNRLLASCARIEGIADYAERLFWRSFRNVETIIHNYERLRVAFSIRCQKSRTVQMYALLAAGHYSLITTGRITDGAIKDYADGLDFGDEPEKDEDLCLGHLLDSKLKVGHEERTIGELLSMAARGDSLAVEAVRALERNGVKIHKDKVYIGAVSSIIKSRYAQTKWARSYKDVLKRTGTPSKPAKYNGQLMRTLSYDLSHFSAVTI